MIKLLDYLISHYEHTSDAFDDIENNEIIELLKQIREIVIQQGER